MQVADLEAFGGLTGELRGSSPSDGLHVELGGDARHVDPVEIAGGEGDEELLHVLGSVLRCQGDEDLALGGGDDDPRVGFGRGVRQARRCEHQRPDTRQTDRCQAMPHLRAPLISRSDDDSGERAAGLCRRQMTPSTKK